VRRRYDVGRSGLALLASIMAANGAYSANARATIPSSDSAVLLLSTEAVVGLAMALWPSGQWSARRRAIGLMAAAAGIVLMIPGPILSAIMVPGCVCPGGSQTASLLGVGHQYWMIIGMVGFPAFMALASLFRSRPARAPDVPAA
jgi:hypothetical protein